MTCKSHKSKFYSQENTKNISDVETETFYHFMEKKKINFNDFHFDFDGSNTSQNKKMEQSDVYHRVFFEQLSVNTWEVSGILGEECSPVLV